MIKFQKHSIKSLIKVCPICKQKFRPTRKEYNYCSVKCGSIASRRKKGQYLIIKCDNCERKHHCKSSEKQRYKHSFCSKKCYSQYRTKKLMGKNNPNWKGGVAKVKGGASSSKKHYVKGRYYERKTRKILEELGYYTVRSAASKGIADVVAFDNREFILIQVKSGTSPFTKKHRVAFEGLPVPFNTKKQLWSWKSNKEPIITHLL